MTMIIEGNFYQVDMISSNDGWIIGWEDYVGGKFQKWDGVNWN